MLAVPVFQERVSPLLDVSRNFALYEIQNGDIKQKIHINIHEDSESLRIEKLKELGVSVIISGAVSCFVSDIIRGKGMKLISWTNGPVDSIVKSYIAGNINECIVEKKKCGKRRRKRCDATKME